jgi:hypothetical protein
VKNREIIQKNPIKSFRNKEFGCYKSYEILIEWLVHRNSEGILPIDKNSRKLSLIELLCFFKRSIQMFDLVFHVLFSIYGIQYIRAFNFIFLILCESCVPKRP